MVIGSAFAPDDFAANDHRVGGEAANPTIHKKFPRLVRGGGPFC
jgi:hypothetical protein